MFFTSWGFTHLMPGRTGRNALFSYLGPCVVALADDFVRFGTA